MEQRLTRRLLSYWQTLCHGNKYPELSHFNTASVEDIMPHCFRVSVEKRTKPIFIYEQMGREIANVHGRSLIGQPIESHTMLFPGKTLHQGLAKAADGVAVEEEGHFLSPAGQMYKYRACMLPFGSVGRGVTHILVGLSWRAF